MNGVSKVDPSGLICLSVAIVHRSSEDLKSWAAWQCCGCYRCQQSRHDGASDSNHFECFHAGVLELR